MASRLSVWSSTVMLATGMLMGVLAGAGAAAADTESDSVSGASTSSESSESAGATGPAHAKSDPDKPRSMSASSAGGDPDPDGQVTTHEAAEGQPAEHQSGSADSGVTAQTSAGDVTTDGSSRPPVVDVDRDQEDVDRHHEADHQRRASATAHPEPPAAVPSGRNAAAEPDAANKDEAAPEEDETAPESTAAATERPGRESLVVKDDAAPEPSVAKSTATMFALAATPDNLATTAASTAKPPTVLDLIGTVFFNVFTVGFRLFQGPPQVPPGSTVTVRTSTLELRPGYEVPADWYVPEDADPERFIYFQHGFITNARTYSYTIAALAEETNSIVVAPSVTSNFFATDAMWLAGVPMQEAIAELFTGNREALTASASDALGYDVTLPQRVVLFGHSYGAQAVVGAASRMDADTIGDVAGIILLDGVSEDLAFSSLNGLPTTLPVYNLSAPDMLLTNFGALNRALANARPGVFNGFQLAGGSHVDAMQGGNPIIQLIANGLLGNRPENVEAANILIAGWVNDMFAAPQEPRTGIYGVPGATVYIPTDAGVATAISVPAPSVPPGIFDRLVSAILSAAVARFYNFEPTEGPLVLF